MFSTRNCLRRTAVVLLTQLVAVTGLSAADLTTWPSQYCLRPWETNHLTAADVVGPDGIVYPDFTGVGVTGGIPDINHAAMRTNYTVFDVTSYGANGSDTNYDSAAVAAAVAAATNHATNGTNKSILYFPAGTYHLTAPTLISQNNVVIDGDGPTNTVIKLVTDVSQTGALFTLKRGAIYQGYLTATNQVARGANTASFNLNPAANGYTNGCWARLLGTNAQPGTTMSARFSNPDNHVVYTDPQSQFGRVFIAKVVSINSTNKTAIFDRTFTHDYFVDDLPNLRVHAMLENCGIQDLTITTVTNTATLDPIRFENAANCWIKNIKTVKARDWPIQLEGVTRFEVRDSEFLGSWADINNGSRAYLGWTSSTDSLMDNCQASNLRHMAIFQLSNRSVVRNCSFSGQSVQSPQLHGRFPHENLIEGSTFATIQVNTTNGTRGLTAYATDGAATLRHGIQGPRNVFYNNRVNSGAGFVHLQGINESLIFAYNRVLKTDDIEACPSIVAMDRTFDTIIRGNIFQTMPYTPFISLEDPTCTGWSVTDNKIYGSSGYLYEGDSAIALAHNNRFFATNAALPSATTPEATSLYAWQLTNAASPRLVLVVDRRTVTDTGGTTEASVTRVQASATHALTVTLSTDIAGLSVPATVEIPAGEVRATFTLTGTSVSGGEKTVTLTASAAGLLGDIEQVFVLDQDVAQPNFGALKHAGSTDGLPSAWRARSYGQVTATCTQSYNAGTDTWSLTGAGIGNETFHGSLYRSGRRFVYQTVEGNGEIRARLTGVSGERQAGLMIADDDASSTDFIWVEPTGQVISSSNTNGSPHARPIVQAAAGSKTVPQWLRILRTGFVFVVSRSLVTAPVLESDWTTIATIDMYRDNVGSADADYKSPAVLDQRMHYGLFLNSGSLTNTASATFTGVQITGSIVGAPAVPSIPPGQTVTGAVGSVFTYHMVASNSPAGFALAGGSLPPGVSLNTTSGQLTGTPTQSGIYTPLFSATNGLGTSTVVTVTCVINDPALLIYEGFQYSLGITHADPDGGLNTNNGLPNSNVGGTPPGTGVGLYGSYGGDHTVVNGLTYADAGGTLSTSGNALRRTTGTGFSATLVRGYRRMSSDPFAAYRAVATNDTFGWNGVASNQLFFSVLLSASATNTGVDNRLVVNLGLDDASWNVYFAQANGTAKWRYGDQAGAGADLGAAVTNQPVLIVGRLSFVSATNFATAYWFNPPLGKPPGSPTFSKSYATTNSGGQFRGIQTRDGSNVVTYDEFRLGTTFAAVTPHMAHPTRLQQFRAAYGLAADGSDDLLTPAGDGVANLAKFAFNLVGVGSGQAPTLGTVNTTALSPTGTAGLPLSGIDGTGRLTLTYIRRKAADNPGITYTIQFSDDLATWAVIPSATESVVSLDTTFERVTITDSTTPQKRFARVQVTVTVP